MKADCRGQWEHVLSSLEQIEGLVIEADRIAFPSKLDDRSWQVIADLMTDLVDANCLMAACTLVRVCEPLVRLDLLNFCGSARVERLRNGGKEVFNHLNRALEATAHKARGAGKFNELFATLRWWPEARSIVMAMFPSLTVEMVSELSGDMFVEAVRLLVDRALTRETAAKCLAELHLLLVVADELKTTHPAWAVTMMAIVCPAIGELPHGVDEAGLTDYAAKLSDMVWLPELTRELVSGLPPGGRREVLCIAAEQAASEPLPEVCVNRLLALAELSDRIGENDGIALKSHLMLVVGWLVVRWSEQTYQAHKSCFESILIRGNSGAQSRFSISIKSKTSYAIGKFATALIGLADGFRNAVESGDLFAAALAIRDCPYPEFCSTALRRLAEAASEKLVAARDDGYLVPLQTATVLVATGNPECSQFAAEILSAHLRTLQDRLSAIRWMMKEVEPAQAAPDDILMRMIDVLPQLCSEEHSPMLDIILMMGEGHELVAQAAVTGFVDGEWDSATHDAIFRALATRVDLGPALPAIHTAVQFEAGGKRRIDKVLDGTPLTDLKRLASWGLYFVSSECRIRHVQPWARGWRFIWTALATNNAFVKEDPLLLMGAIAIDAAAADDVRGGVDELLHRLTYPWAQEALDAMLQLQVNNTPLLSEGDLHNILRAMFSDEQLGRDTLVWMGQVDDPDRRVALHAAAAHALISLADDFSPCRFYPDRPANHVVGAIVRMYEFRVMRLLKIGKDVAANMGPEAWHRISSKFPPSRSEIASGMG